MNGGKSRREFVKQGTLLAGGLMAAPLLSRANLFSGADDAIKIALIGCGGRGTGACMQALLTKQNVKLVAMADAFRDRLDSCLKNLSADDISDWSGGKGNIKARIDFDDLHFERRRYDGWEAYAQSKLANLLHAKTLAKRLGPRGIVAVSVHPGWVRTNLIHNTVPTFVQDWLLRPFLRLQGMIEPWEGTQTSLYALLAPEVERESGAFYSQTGMYRDKALNKGGWPLRSPNPNAHDDAAAERLDAVSRALVGLA